MKALIWREYRLAKLQRGTVFTVWIVGTVFLLFLPNIRTALGNQNFSLHQVFMIGSICIPAYIVMFLLYEGIKEERRSRTLEKLYAFYGIKQIVIAKTVFSMMISIVSGCFFILAFYVYLKVSEIPFTIGIYTALWICPIIISAFSWFSTLLMMVSDNLLITGFVCLIPMAFVTISLINNFHLYIAAFVVLITAGLLLQIVALKQEEHMLP